MEQKISSKDTSTRKISSIYTHFDFDPYTNIMDFGCGKYFEDTKEFIKNLSPTSDVYGYDPYNRTEEQNNETFKLFDGTTADYLICSDVMNVIAEDECVLELLKLMNKYASESSKIILSVHRKDNSGPYISNRGYQRNMKAKEYEYLVSQVFDIVSIKGKFIVCKKKLQEVA